ncbi:winged helix-turn-helix transcriptional regulator [Weissella confusa]|uniref:Transcriptional regulator n=1 Tax=Limosilactobacillus reuteri TaxID=1598 RepID=A0A2T5Q1L5_LIMRT|nr:winged helix-turn-helix transcriptional regulator [Limosilactobacillus reuteri]MCC4410777.1 winged helix-turn-helix transcriptional regulator [Limosilactobacillus reuteri]MCW3764593.1 winged helix-turn-helix transcriptional regulator [Weissella confusa]MDL2057513.1 winged helix-turn-helix transcriptional regulator [Limosilactobacillus reuteri]PTV01583.1 transcriptional regulator [Limosilactobacillus reuteri]
MLLVIIVTYPIPSVEMLTKSLRELEEDGLLKRISKGTVPPSVTYHLTDTGKSLIYTMGDLFEWGKTHEMKDH